MLHVVCCGHITPWQTLRSVVLRVATLSLLLAGPAMGKEVLERQGLALQQAWLAECLGTWRLMLSPESLPAPCCHGSCLPACLQALRLRTLGVNRQRKEGHINP
jgi:hypothetical protein